MSLLPDLSRAEFDILRVLWKNERLSIREVHDALQETYKWAYSTTKTMMDRMVKKELLAREEFVADRVLEMDQGSVVSLFARNKVLSPDEIEELTQLLKSNES